MNITNGASTTTKTGDINESNLELNKNHIICSRVRLRNRLGYEATICTTTEEVNNGKDLVSSKV